MISKPRTLIAANLNGVTVWGYSPIFLPDTVFILIEARRASAGISPSETVLISGENNYRDRNTTYPLYITSFHCYMTY